MLKDILNFLERNPEVLILIALVLICALIPVGIMLEERAKSKERLALIEMCKEVYLSGGELKGCEKVLNGK